MKLCLAGTSGVYESTRPILKDVPYLLESFYYFKDFQKPLIHNADLFLLDSGAFTFMNGAKGKVNWNSYIDKYISFINENGVKYYFELDIDVIVGYDEVKRIRAKLERETGVKSIPVWHKSRGIEEYKRLVNDYDYIAIGGFAIKDINKTEYPIIKKMVEYAYNRGVKVHGLGFTPKDVTKYKFYSVDSTSWTSCRRFGSIFKYNHGEMKMVTPKKHGTKRDKQKEIEIITVKEWTKYQKYLNRSCQH
ncbi:MAG: hypothetical protein ACI4XP_03175 [Acutalibacteraceae bacterium]